MRQLSNVKIVSRLDIVMVSKLAIPTFPNRVNVKIVSKMDILMLSKLAILTYDLISTYFDLILTLSLH